MNTHRALSTFIVITATTFSLTFGVSHQFLITLLALAAGITWFKLENSQGPVPATLFFLFYVALAIMGALSELPAPVMLFGLSANLAAWDLSRFRRRVAITVRHDSTMMLEKKHLQRLFSIVCFGLLIALLPLVMKLSIDFVAFAALTLLLMVILRSSVVLLRHEHKNFPE